MTVSLTPTHMLVDLLSFGGRAPARTRRPAKPAEGLLPASWTAWLAARASARAFAASMARLEDIAPHLLDDIGVSGVSRPVPGLGDLPSVRGAQSPKAWDVPAHWLR